MDIPSARNMCFKCVWKTDSAAGHARRDPQRGFLVATSEISTAEGILVRFNWIGLQGGCYES